MVLGVPEAALPTIDTATLRPFMSFLLLEYTGTDLTRPVQLVMDFLLGCAQTARGVAERVVVAQGFQEFEFPETGPQPDELAGFVYQLSKPPSWALPEVATYRDQTHELVTTIRWGKYLAIGGAEFRDRVERWIRSTEVPPFRLVPDLVLEQALLVGEAKGLWMSGTHHRSRAKADTKNITGINLHESLSPLEDGSFALNSGRAALADDPGRVALTGIVGTTPRRSVAWNRPSQSFSEYVTGALELLHLIDETAATGAETSALPQLAASVATLAGISLAYDVLLPGPDDVASQPEATEDQVAAAWELDGSVIEVVGVEHDPDFTLVLGTHGSEVGRVAVHVHGTGRTVEFSFTTAGTPSDPQRFAVLRDALDLLNDLTVYYGSRHVIRLHQAFLSQVPSAPFRNWQFADFTGFHVSMEKPGNAQSEDAIHGNCGEPGDTSLFGWVAKRYAVGHLLCDDGSGEIADFIHLAPDQTLTLIHVKAAFSASIHRQLAAGPYELVASQATKNLLYLDPRRLSDRLQPTVGCRRASWQNGARCPNRQPFLDALAIRSPRAPTKVVIVQPHVTEARYLAAAADDGVQGYRLQLLDMLLNAASATISQGAGAVLEVVGAQ